MNHIPDTGKMVGETPISDSTPHNVAELSMLCRRLERELQETHGRIRLLIAERDSARQQAAQNWKLRDEFTALIGTDDVKEAVRKLKLVKAALECALPYCEYLHHKKAHQHASGAKCVPEELVRMAKRISTTQTK